MTWFVYLIPEETKSGESFYCGQTSDPSRRWEEHKKKRYSKKCRRCNGKGKIDNTNSRSFRDRIESCSKCEGKGKVPGNRVNKGEMRVVPFSFILESGKLKWFDKDCTIRSLSDAVNHEKYVKCLGRDEKKAFYEAGTSVKEVKC